MVRAPDLRRLALIGDSVFAVSITLNARAVTIPKLDGQGFDTPAYHAFIGGMAAVLLSVLVASAFWLGHWRYFRHVRTIGPGFIAAHFAFLLALILLPVSTDLYASNRLNTFATIVYGLNLLFLTAMALVFRLVAIRHTPGRAVHRYDWIGLVGVLALFVLAVLLAKRSPQWSQVCWYLGFLSPVVETLFGRRLAVETGRGWTR